MSKTSSDLSSKLVDSETQKGILRKLRQAQAFNRIWHSQDFQEHLLPYLQVENKWLDPRQFKSQEDFQWAYQESWGKAQAFRELIKLLQESEITEVKISEQFSKRKTSYKIGSVTKDA